MLILASTQGKSLPPDFTSKEQGVWATCNVERESRHVSQHTARTEQQSRGQAWCRMHIACLPVWVGPSRRPGLLQLKLSSRELVPSGPRLRYGCPMEHGDGNVFEHVPARLSEEQLTELVATPGLRIERIVSTGQASPADFWYDQDRSEWVLVLSGSAGLLIEGEAEPRLLRTGDYVLIPPRTRHRVAWTDPEKPTIWLAVHFG